MSTPTRVLLGLCAALALAPLGARAQSGGPVTLGVSAGTSGDALPVLVDRQNPIVVITSPGDGSTLAGSAVTATGTVSDRAYGDETSPPSPVYGEVSWRLRGVFGEDLGGGSVPVVEGRFTIPDLPLGAGENSLSVTAVDAGGWVGESGVSLISDPDAPAVALVSPRDGEAVLASSVSVALNFSEATTLVAVNGTPDGRVLGPGLVTDALTVPLALGPNVVTLELEGPSGVFQHAFTLFRVESLDPPRITSIQDGGFTNQPTLAVTGTVPLGTPYVEVNGIRATLDGAAFAATVPLQQGENTITVVAYPQAAPTQIHVTCDSRPPGIRNLFPDDGTLTLEGEVLIGAVLDEAARVEVSGPVDEVVTDTRAQVLGSLPFGGNLLIIHLAELDPLELADGPNDLVFTATDRAGNQTVVDFLVTKSGAALVLSSPADGSSVPALRVAPVVEVLAPVTIDALYSGALRVPGFEGGTLSTGLVSLPPIPLVPGANEIRIVYRRAGGPPEATRFAFQSAATDAMTVTGTVRDAATGAAVGGALVSIQVNGLTVVAVTGTDGSYAVKTEAGNATVVAMAESYSTESTAGSGVAGDTVLADLDLDDTGIPGLVNELAIVVPPAGTVTDFEQLTVVGTVLNPLSSVTVNGIAAEVVGHRFTARHVPLAMGANTISVIASALGAPPVTTSVTVERAAEPVLAVKIFSPPEGATIPGGGLVVRGFVSAKDARTALTDTGFVAVDEGVFQVNDIMRPSGDVTLRLESTLPDGSQAEAATLPLHFGSADPALTLQGDPAYGTPPLQSTLALEFAAEAFDIERIDFDVDGDGTLDVLASPTAEVQTTYAEAGPLVARAFVSTPQGVELSAPATLRIHLPHVILREFAAGNPVDLAEGTGGSFFVLDGAAARVARYDADGVLLGSFGSSGSAQDQMRAPSALAVARDGRLFVADTGNQRVQVFSENGVWQRSIDGDGDLVEPRGVAIVDDELVVSEGDDRIRTFSLEGELRSSVTATQPRGIADVSGFGALIASPVDGLLSLLDGRLEPLVELTALPPSLGAIAAVDIAVGDGALLVADAASARVVVLSPRFAFRRAIDVLGAPPIAVLPSARREVESFYAADGTKVVEIGIPAISPLPVVQELKSHLLVSNVEGALELIHPLQRDLFQEIYAAVGSDLPIDAAAMTELEVDLLRESHAIVRIRTVEDDNGTIRESSSRMHLVRMEDGSWRIFDY
jgi:hypothetical protein